MAKKLKPEQKDAIELEKNLIVPANAGSGKTFVMLQRVVFNIVEKKSSVLDFLMITFTNLAASQMRTKLHKELLKAFNETEDEEKKKHIKEQIGLLPVSDISTIHTFCLKLIQKYFYVANVEGNLNVIDEQASNDIKEKAIETTLNTFCKAQNDDFLELMLSYDNKRNFNTLKEIIFKLFKFSTNSIDKEQTKMNIRKIYEEDFENTLVFKTLNDFVLDIVSYWKNSFQKLLIETKQSGAKKLEEVCESILVELEKFKESFSFKETHKTLFFEIQKFKDMPRKVDENEKELSQVIKSKKEELTLDLKKAREKFLFDDFEKLKQDLVWCKRNVGMILRMEEDFEKNYQELKKQKNVVDFSDLEHLTLKILENGEICREISEEFKQIFVDEYQDVNDIQEEIVNRLWKSGKNLLFLVGDPKQSIYRFRNTNPDIMMNKLKIFSNEKEKSIPLQYNFRSNKNILSFVNFVFSKIMTLKTGGVDYQKEGMFFVGLDDFKEDKNFPSVEIELILDKKEKEEKIVPTKVYSVKEAETKEEDELIFAKTEAFVIASKISDMLKNAYMIYDPDEKENGGLRKLEFDDIALLYRSRGEYVDTILEELEKLGFPVRKVSQESILEEYEVQVLVNFLKLLSNLKDDYALTSFLTSPFIGLSFEELSTLKREKNESFSDCVLKSENEKIKFALSLLNDARQHLFNNTIFSLLNWLLAKTNYKDFLLALPNGMKKVLNVNVFVNDFQNHSYNNDLIEYLSFLEKNDKVKIDAMSMGETSAINVLTMHHSKGLEFPIVFILNSSHQFNTNDQKGPCLFSKKLGIGVQKFDKEKRFKTNTIVRSAIVVDEMKNLFAEELRVLYVGLTRAKNHLFVLGKCDLEKLDTNCESFALLKKNNPFSLILSSLNSGDLNAIKLGQTNLQIKTGEDTSFYINVFQPMKINSTDLIMQKKCQDDVLKYEDVILGNIKLNENFLENQKEGSKIALKSSVSRLMEKEDKRENVSQGFKKFFVQENEVSPNEIGNAFHEAMQIIPFDVNSIDEIEDFLRKNMQGEHFKLINSEKIFKCVQFLKPWVSKSKKTLREAKFYLHTNHNNIVKDGSENKILIQGVVDLIIVLDNEAILVDFKTNREKNDENLKEKYKIQLECYKIAIENALKIKVSSKILYSFFKDYAIFV